MADEYPITWGELLDFQSRVVSCRQALATACREMPYRAGLSLGPGSGCTADLCDLQWSARARRGYGRPCSMRTGCPSPGGRHGGCSPAVFGTWTISTTRTGYASSLTGGPVTPPEQKWQDADRDNDNLFAGDVQTVRFGLRDVTVRRCAWAAQLAAVLMRRGWDGAGLHGAMRAVR